MIKNGTGPTTLDTRDYSYHRTFGTIPKPLENRIYSYLRSQPIPDQNAEGLPMGCTGETQTFLKGIQDDSIYDAAWQYAKTCLMEWHGPEKGCDIRNSSKSLRVFGAKRIDETTDEEAAKHKSGKTFNVDKVPGLDWFDSFRTPLRLQKQGISVGTIWFPEWEGVGKDGELSPNFAYDGNPFNYPWHNYAFTGENIMYGEPVIEAISWQGVGYADKGKCYFNRATFNRAFDISGTIGLITLVATPEDILTIKLDLVQALVMFLNRILLLIGMQKINALS